MIADAKNTQLKLTDITGRVIYTELLNLHAGSTSLPINVAKLASGTYFLQLSNSQSSSVKKFVVQ
jgi:hypothetical protein